MDDVTITENDATITETTETETTPTDDAVTKDDAAKQPEDTVDWKKESRKWERRAKEAAANREKDQSEADERMRDVEAELEELRRENLIMKVSRETNVDPDLLRNMSASDEADMRDCAAMLVNFAKANASHGYAGIPDTGEPAPTPSVTVEDISAIKSPSERIRARAQHLDLYL